MKAATARTGFFQEAPKLDHNQFEADEGLQRMLAAFESADLTSSAREAARRELASLGDAVVTPQIFDYVDEAERNLPFIVEQDTFGHSVNRLITSDGWKRLKDFAFEKGIVSSAYERTYGNYSRQVSFAKLYLFCPSSGLVSCPLAMTDGCARVLEVNRLNSSTEPVFKRLISRDPSQGWTSGQWMTERPGGSDVSKSETIAKKDGDDYRVSGFKWFSSATDSQVSVLLAHRVDDNGNHLDNGRLSCFLGYVQEGDHVRIHRLKQKFGTKPLPTAELELSDMRCQLLGKPGSGVKAIATVLNITRLYSAICSLSYWRRSYYIAKEYSKVRRVFGKVLSDIPAHVRVLAEQEISLRGHGFLLFYGTSLLGKEETGTLANAHEEVLLRLIPGLSKVLACKRAINGISECMEGLGGAGYLEHDVKLNIAKHLRDAQVNAIWEGTTNVLCDDLVRALNKSWSASKAALDWLIKEKSVPSKQSLLYKELKGTVLSRYAKWVEKIEASSLEQLRREGRPLMFELGDIVISALLLVDVSDGSSLQDSAANAIASVWALERPVDDYAVDYLIVYGQKANLSKL